MTPTPKLAFLTIAATLAYLGLAILMGRICRLLLSPGPDCPAVSGRLLRFVSRMVNVTTLCPGHRIGHPGRDRCRPT